MLASQVDPNDLDHEDSRARTHGIRAAEETVQAWEGLRLRRYLDHVCPAIFTLVSGMPQKSTLKSHL